MFTSFNSKNNNINTESEILCTKLKDIMGSTSYLSKSRLGKIGAYKAPKSVSSVCSDKENNAKIKRNKIRRSGKMNEYGAKRYPDYTEMAYKEAVSKLRYFLNGNYTPSLRSYGGSTSIKNLEESDAETAIDTKKLYPMSVYGTPADYRTKVRPLMSRYLNTYADSYKHYGSSATNMQNTSHTVAGASVSPSTLRPPVSVPPSNPDMITFVQKQEEYIEQLEREGNYCRDELNNLLGKVKEVISENENLHEAQKNKLISRVFSYRGAGSESDEDDLVDSTGLDSDNKTSPRKFKLNCNRSGLHGPNIVFESRIAELEAQLMQANINLKKVQEENGENKRKISKGIVDSSCIDSFRRQIENLQRDKGSLEVQVKKLESSLEQHKCGDKVLNQIKAGNEHLEQQLRDERNNLETELRSVKDELASERGKLRSVAGEGARRALQERDLAQRRYGQHLEEMSHDLAAQYDAVGKLQLELERQRREESDLKRELSMKTTALEDLKMDFKNKTASLQADLAQAQAEKSSLEEELGNARLALERVQRQGKHDANRLNSEISSLRSRLDRADADVVHARRENLRLAEQLANAEKELNMRNLRPETPTKDKELSNILESMENKHGKANSRGRSEQPIRTQHASGNIRDRPMGKERRARRSQQNASDSSNRLPAQPVTIGPLSTNQDFNNLLPGERIFKLPLTIQQPFLHEKKEPIKVDISVKLVSRPKKKDRKKEKTEDSNATRNGVAVLNPTSEIGSTNVCVPKNNINIDIISPIVVNDTFMKVNDEVKMNTIINIDEKIISNDDNTQVKLEVSQKEFKTAEKELEMTEGQGKTEPTTDVQNSESVETVKENVDSDQDTQIHMNYINDKKQTDTEEQTDIEAKEHTKTVDVDIKVQSDTQVHSLNEQTDIDYGNTEEQSDIRVNDSKEQKDVKHNEQPNIETENNEEL